MSKIGSSIKPKVFLIDLLILIVGISLYIVFYQYTYSSLKINVVADNFIEYGTKEYNLEKFIKNSNGMIYTIEDKINTNKVGKQKVLVTLRKYNVLKKVSFYVDVVDKVAPVIKFKENTINITAGEDYNVLDNIESVIDDVDGIIEYNSSNIKSKNYYTIDTDFNNKQSGTYNVEVIAYDKSNNESKANFSIVVEEPKVVHRKVTYATSSFYNPSSNGVVSTAYSLIGSPYVAMGNSPSGFDCSGFVQYVYASNGISISRSSSTQAFDGVEISYSDILPGDILIWGYDNGVITHSALYVGNDLMIHAANPSTGVILSSVSGWIRGSNVVILHVRRI